MITFVRSVLSGRRERRWLSAAWLLLPGTLVLGTLFVAPLVLLSRLSFFRYEHATGAWIGPVIDTWSRLLGSAYYRGILWDTLTLGGLVTGVTLIIGYPLAYVLARLRTRFVVVLLAALTLPLLTSAVVRTFAWMVLLSSNGILNHLLVATGLTAEPVQMMYTWGAVVVGLIQIFLPFTVLTLYGVLRNVDVSLEEAAASLGANRFQTFRRVLLPLTLAGVTTGALLVFSLTVTSFVTPALLGGRQIRILPNLIYEQALVVFDWPLASAAALVLLLVVGGLAIAVSRLGEAGTTLGGRQ